MGIDKVDWMALHVRALFVQDQDGCLVRANESGGVRAPRFFLGRTEDGYRCWFGAGLIESTRAELEGLAATLSRGSYDEPVDPGPFREVLDREVQVSSVWAGPAYRFPTTFAPPPAEAQLIDPSQAGVLDPYLSEWSGDVEAYAPFAVAKHDGAAVSLCASVRRTDAADEAGVETHPDFRGRGHAGRAVARWASEVRRSGRHPLYSTSWDNTASISVATKLGLIHFGSDLHMA